MDFTQSPSWHLRRTPTLLPGTSDAEFASIQAARISGRAVSSFSQSISGSLFNAIQPFRSQFSAWFDEGSTVSNNNVEAAHAGSPTRRQTDGRLTLSSRASSTQLLPGNIDRRSTGSTFRSTGPGLAVMEAVAASHRAAAAAGVTAIEPEPHFSGLHMGGRPEQAMRSPARQDAVQHKGSSGRARATPQQQLSEQEQHEESAAEAVSPMPRLPSPALARASPATFGVASGSPQSPQSDNTSEPRPLTSAVDSGSSSTGAGGVSPSAADESRATPVRNRASGGTAAVVGPAPASDAALIVGHVSLPRTDAPQLHFVPVLPLLSTTNNVVGGRISAGDTRSIRRRTGTVPVMEGIAAAIQASMSASQASVRASTHPLWPALAPANLSTVHSAPAPHASVASIPSAVQGGAGGAGTALGASTVRIRRRQDPVQSTPAQSASTGLHHEQPPSVPAHFAPGEQRQDKPMPRRSRVAVARGVGQAQSGDGRGGMRASTLTPQAPVPSTAAHPIPYVYTSDPAPRPQSPAQPTPTTTRQGTRRERADKAPRTVPHFIPSATAAIPKAPVASLHESPLGHTGSAAGAGTSHGYGRSLLEQITASSVPSYRMPQRVQPGGSLSDLAALDVHSWVEHAHVHAASLERDVQLMTAVMRAQQATGGPNVPSARARALALGNALASLSTGTAAFRQDIDSFIALSGRGTRPTATDRPSMVVSMAVPVTLRAAAGAPHQEPSPAAGTAGRALSPRKSPVRTR